MIRVIESAWLSIKDGLWIMDHELFKGIDDSVDIFLLLITLLPFAICLFTPYHLHLITLFCRDR